MGGAPLVGPASAANLICRDLWYGIGPRGLLEISHRPIADRIAITAPLFTAKGPRRTTGLDYGQLVSLDSLQ